MTANVRRMRWAFVPAVIFFGVLFYVSLPIPRISLSVPSVSIYQGQHAEAPLYPTSSSSDGQTSHPISKLIQHGEKEFSALLSKETHDLASATRAYRKARRRHPPPGFDTWYNVAKAHNVIMVEDFWDQIYHDLQPFWAIPPKQIRADARANDMTINIRRGKAEPSNSWFWLPIWADMISKVSMYLPDMVIPCNSMDEPRLLVPWETINSYMEKGSQSRRMPRPAQVSDVYHNWAKDDKDSSVEATKVDWKDSASISLVRQACHPDSRIRHVNAIDEDTGNGAMSEHLLDGFVANYTLSTNLCHQPDIGMYHGAVNQPLTSSWSQQLIPLFGGSKLGVNNEILLPPPMTWTDDPKFTVAQSAATDWGAKKDQSIWRGTATGGRHHPTSWHRFHRHRFAYLTNSTKMANVDEAKDKILTSSFMHMATSGLQPSTRHHISEYLSATNDVAFTDLFCDEPGENGSCWYLDKEFAVVPAMPLSQQFNSKYLPDVDGNSFSGRYRAFLMSTSVPIKATIYREWHDARLVAWKHFVPMDNRFIDYYRIMEYFMGFAGSDGSEEIPGHDDAAKKIAYDGRDWANKVLRKEDMWIYVFRLLLEYARVCDDNRQLLGYVGDLK